MKICIVGLGSIAVRHIRNLRSLAERSDMTISVIRSGKGNPIPKDVENLIDEVLYDTKEIKGKYDAIFITNPTSLHYKTLELMLSFGDSFFVEKPVFLTGEEDLTVFNDKLNRIYVACPLRYSEVIQHIKKSIDLSKIFAVRCICSSYLPDWRKGVDYKKSYSAHREMGGGVSIDLIHEWDYLTYLFGTPNCVKSIITKKSGLMIDSDDIAVYIADYKNMVLELHLDYFGRTAMRQIELFTADDILCADLYKSNIISRKSGEILNFREIRDDYQKKELEHFIDIMKGQTFNDNTLEYACSVLRIARGKE